MKDRVIRELRTDIFNKTEKINVLKLKNKKLKRYVTKLLVSLEQTGLLNDKLLKELNENAEKSKFDQEFLEKCLKYVREGTKKEKPQNNKKLDAE